MVTITPVKTIADAGLVAPAAALVSGGDLLVRERARPVVPTGFRALDALLPAGGVRPGSLVEWLVEGDAGPGAGGAASLAFAVACRLAAEGSDAGERRQPRTIVVVDRTGWFHPPAILPWLTGEQRLVVARPSRDDDEIWAIDQALRCTGVAAVLAWPRARRSGARAGVRAGSPLGGARRQWSTALRRWQLAAAGSGAVGLLVRPAVTLAEPSWAEARVVVSPHAGGSQTERRLRLALAGGSWSAITADGRCAAEVTLDLTSGCAGMTRSAAAVSGRSAVACRAS